MSHEVAADFVGKQKTLKSYLIGFGVSLALTVLAFVFVGMNLLSASHLYMYVSLLAVAQLITQVTCFIGLNNSEEGWWSLLPFLFTVLIIAILVTGSLWIMYHLNINMMP